MGLLGPVLCHAPRAGAYLFLPAAVRGTLELPLRTAEPAVPLPKISPPPPPASASTSFADPAWQRWFSSLGAGLQKLLPQLFLNSGGSITGDTSITGNLTVSGSVTCQTLAQTSDERLKHRWRRLPGGFVEGLAALKLKNRAGTFGWRAGGGRAAGVSAQEVARFCPLVVLKGSDGLHRVDYGVLGTLAAVELAGRMLRAESRVKQLEENLTELQDRLARSEWREGLR